MTTSTRASVAEPEVRHPVATDRSRGWLLGWLCAEAALLFLVSWVGADLLGLHHDLYLLVYFTVALTFLAAFLARSGVDWRAYLRRNLAWSVGLGAVVAVLGVRNVWGDESTPRPSGAYLGFEVAWRGVAYGVVDALMLYGLPALVAYLVLRGHLGGAWRRVGVAALTLFLVLATTVVYHLGYAQFRDRDLREPATGAAAADPIAIVGMGCRFPGGADSPDAFWSLLVNGVDAISEVPRTRWDVERIFDADTSRPGRTP